MRTFLKFSCHKGFSGDTFREVRSLAGLQPLKSQMPSFLYYMTEEGREGKNAFLEKRRPDFSKFQRLP